MPRSQNKVASHRRRKRVMKQAKGYWGARSKVLSVAICMLQALFNMVLCDRKAKKRTIRQLWITRINAAARLNGTTYSQLMSALNQKEIEINRKVLADLAANDAAGFTEIVKFARS